MRAVKDVINKVLLPISQTTYVDLFLKKSLIFYMILDLLLAIRPNIYIKFIFLSAIVFKLKNILGLILKKSKLFFIKQLYYHHYIIN